MEISLGPPQVPSPHQMPAPDPLALEQLPTGAKAGTVRESEQLGEREPIKPSLCLKRGRVTATRVWGPQPGCGDRPSPQAPAPPSCPKAAPHQREGCCCGRGEERAQRVPDQGCIEASFVTGRY